MKKVNVISLLFLLFINCAGSTKTHSAKEDKAPPVVIRIINTSLDHGNVYLSDTVSPPNFVGRVKPGQTTELKIPAPFPSNRYKLSISLGGHVQHSVILADIIKPGDKIEWNLFSNFVVWEPMEMEL